jgi:hypothetical protein
VKATCVCAVSSYAEGAQRRSQRRARSIDRQTNTEG